MTFIQLNNFGEKRFEDISSEWPNADVAIQGGAVSDTHIFVTEGRQGGQVSKYNKSDLTRVQHYTDVVSSDIQQCDVGMGNGDNIMQTAHYYDGELFIMTRCAQIHVADPSDMTIKRSQFGIIPDSELVTDHRIFEGITRYEGQAFSEPKWFVQDRNDVNEGDRAFYRLSYDTGTQTFSYDKKYVISDTNPYLTQSDTNDGYDGIEIFDYKNKTIALGAITSDGTAGDEHPDHPGLDVFEYVPSTDEFNRLGKVVINASENQRTPDEGFQIDKRGTGSRDNLDSAYAGLRDVGPAIVEMDFSDLIDLIVGAKTTDSNGVKATTNGVKQAQ